MGSHISLENYDLRNLSQLIATVKAELKGSESYSQKSGGGTRAVVRELSSRVGVSQKKIGELFLKKPTKLSTHLLVAQENETMETMNQFQGFWSRNLLHGCRGANHRPLGHFSQGTYWCYMIGSYTVEFSSSGRCTKQKEQG